MTFLLRTFIAPVWLFACCITTTQAETNTTPASSPRTATNTNAAGVEQKYYAITLITSFESIDIRKTAKEFPKQDVYLIRTNVLGKTVYFVRLGFFPTFADANAMKDRLLSRYPGAWATSVSSQEHSGSRKIEEEPEIPPPAEPAKPTPSPTPTLLKSPSPATAVIGVPAPLPLPVPETKSATAPEPASKAQPAVTETDKLAEPLMKQGRDALTNNNNALAIQAFDRLLNLPPNKYSQDAQEFIGLARERNNELAKAGVEYKLYLKLYPDSEGADRVRQRLLNLGKVKIPEPRQKLVKKEANQTFVYGGWSQYYYNGTSQNSDTTVGTPVPITTSTSATVQSALFSTLDLNVRMRSSDYDNRAVLRNTYVLDFLNSNRNDNKLNSAYFELKNRKYDYYARMGRQSGYGGGVLGRFDGLQVGYRLSPKWQINAVTGKPADLTISSDVKFSGISMDLGTFAEHWSGSAYWITQQVDGIADRDAIGGDLRYYDPHQSYYTLVDYDTLYSTLNTMMLQATWITESQTTYNLLLDYRNAPTLQTTNAVLGQTVSSIITLLQTTTEDALHQKARDNTPVSKVFLLGFTRPYNKTWQYGLDIRGFSTSDTLLSPGTSSNTITVQSIGTGLLTPRDITLLSYAYTDGGGDTTNSISLNNRSPIGDKWNLTTQLVYSVLNRSIGSHSTDLRPTLRIAYKWKEKVTLELEANFDIAKIDSPTTQSVRHDPFYSLGYRWDF